MVKSWNILDFKRLEGEKLFTGVSFECFGGWLIGDRVGFGSIFELD